MNKVRTMQEAYRVFELLGMKEVTKKWQKAKGTEVWELPLKTMYNNGNVETNRFTIYKNGYVRKMCVGPNGASCSCYQINKVRKVAEFVKDYDYNDETCEFTWNGKYRKIYGNVRVMVDNHRDRVVYLCNYILKNYYRKMDLVGDYTVKRMKIVHGEWWRGERNKVENDLPFFNGDEHDLVRTIQSEDTKHGISPNHKIQVIIDGHRYNLS